MSDKPQTHNYLLVTRYCLLCSRFVFIRQLRSDAGSSGWKPGLHPFSFGCDFWVRRLDFRQQPEVAVELQARARRDQSPHDYVLF